MPINRHIYASLAVLLLSLAASIFFLTTLSVAKTQYSGGSGTADDPYQIATAADLIALGETPEDYDKHFILAADIDLDPNLTGGKVFDRAVIAPDVIDFVDGLGGMPDFDGTPFTGKFDGGGRVISHLTITGASYLGLFGKVAENGAVHGLTLEQAVVKGRWYVGSLIGYNEGGVSGCQVTCRLQGERTGGLAAFNAGSIAGCRVTGKISSLERAGYSGGLAGSNKGTVVDSHAGVDVTGGASSWHMAGLVGSNRGPIINCHATGNIAGGDRLKFAGGLVGLHQTETITLCSATGHVSGGAESNRLAGLVGGNPSGGITRSYATGDVTAGDNSWGLGGLAGDSLRTIADCWSSGNVSNGDGGWGIGGMIGYNQGIVTNSYATGSVSGRDDTQHVGALIGKNSGSADGCFWDKATSRQATSAGGTGLTTAQMQTAATFLDAGWDFVGETANGPNDVWKIVESQTYPLLSRHKYGGGTGEPNDPYLIYTAEHLDALGAEPNDYDKHFKLLADIDLSGYTYDRAVIAPDVNDAAPFQGRPFSGTLDGNGHVISNLRLVAEASCDNYLGLFGELHGAVRDLGLASAVIQAQPGGRYVGVMAGSCDGTIQRCYVRGSVLGNGSVAGLAGSVGGDASVVDSYAQVEVGVFEGTTLAGGLVAMNSGTIRTSYATGSVGGVPSYHSPGGLVSVSYSPVVLSFWDTESSGVSVSYGGFGRTTAEMQTATTFVGWSGDVWELAEGNYPRLAWEGTGGVPMVNEVQRSYAGAGTEEEPFLLVDANDLYVLACRPDDWHGQIGLTQDIDMSSIGWYPTIANFRGVLNGNGHVIHNLRIHEKTSMLGLVGFMQSATIQDLTLEDVSIAGYSRLGGLVGVAQDGQITNCACEGTLSGMFKIGGLAGQLGSAQVVDCAADFMISAGDPAEIIGGLVGHASECIIRDSYAEGALTAGKKALFCGGLAGGITKVSISDCYAAFELTLGKDGRYIGGLIGRQSNSCVESSYWDLNVSRFRESDGGMGLTTAQMQKARTFLDAGWDFVDETDNGTEDIWRILEGQDYPRLWWERVQEDPPQ